MTGSEERLGAPSCSFDGDPYAPFVKKGAFVFASGWAVGNRFWQPLLHELETLASQNASIRKLFAKPVVPLIGIGHSFGFHRLLRMGGFQTVIAICPFYRLCRHGDGHPFDAHALHPAVISRMIVSLRKNPQKCLRDFYGRAGLPAVIMPEVSGDIPGAELPPDGACDVFSKATLAQGLEALKSADVTPLREMQTHVLADAGDAIVPASLISSQFADCPVTWTKGAGHGLGYHQAAWCAKMIAELISGRQGVFA